MDVGALRCGLQNQVSFTWNLSASNSGSLHKLPCYDAFWTTRLSFRNSAYSRGYSMRNQHNVASRTYSLPVSLEESPSVQSEDYPVEEEREEEDTSNNPLDRPLSSEELKSLLADSERSKLVNKLSEANQQNRFFKRQLQAHEDSLANFKSELAVMELEVQALVKLAEEIANSEIPKDSRKINGKYIQCHLLSRLEAVQEKMKEQVKDVGAAQSKEVPIAWSGMAESVQVMGTFDGWSQGEHLSPEYTGSYARFSTTLMLRRGRYEIKFLVDGEWQLSPEFPTVGEGIMKNNLLVVD